MSLIIDQPLRRAREGRMSIWIVLRIGSLVAAVGFMFSLATLPAESLITIVGVVKDSSGAVLPGVTVEAASPVLIEKARETVTDGEGRYRIAELRPGSYAVTFTLAGFATFKRDGLDLTQNFVATINAELRVGTLTETVVVTGETPLVDARSVAKGAVISQAILSALPTSKSVGSMLAFVPGAVSPTNGVDTGGTKGEQSVRISVFAPGRTTSPDDQRHAHQLNGRRRPPTSSAIAIQENVVTPARQARPVSIAGAAISDSREGGSGRGPSWGHQSAAVRQPGHDLRSRASRSSMACASSATRTG